MEIAEGLIIVRVPVGVSQAEFADHIADASRLAVAGYHASDPMSRLGEIEVLGSVPRTELPAAEM